MADPDEHRVQELVHELHNALGIVITYCSLVLEAVENEPQAKADVTEIQIAGRRAVELVGELTTLMRGAPPAS